MLIVLMMGSSVASAEDKFSVISLTAICLISLPIMTAAVLIIIALPELLGRAYRREPATFHIANVITVTSVITFIIILGVAYSLSIRSNTTLAFATIGVVVLLIVNGIFVRYLHLSFPWATIAGGAVAILTVSLAYLAMGTPGATMDRIEGVLVQALPLWLLVWLGLLAMETAKYHIVEVETHKGPDGPRVPRRRRMLRLGELLIINMAVAAGLSLIWFS